MNSQLHLAAGDFRGRARHTTDHDSLRSLEHSIRHERPTLRLRLRRGPRRG